MRRTILVALGIMLLLPACGRARGAIAIPQGDIPFSVERSSQPELPNSPRAQYRLSFIRRGRLVDVVRSLPTRIPAESVMISLLDGPTTQEADRGLTTEIPEEARLLQVVVADQVAQVNLSPEFQTAAPSANVFLRVAQVVRSLTLLRGIEAVQFLIDGVQVEVPTDHGVVERPVSAPDYASVSPRK